MKDWYPGRDSNRAVSLKNFGADIDRACGEPGVYTSPYAKPSAAAHAQRQGTQRDFDSARLLLQKQAAATPQHVRAILRTDAQAASGAAAVAQPPRLRYGCRPGKNAFTLPEGPAHLGLH